MCCCGLGGGDLLHLFVQPSSAIPLRSACHYKYTWLGKIDLLLLACPDWVVVHSGVVSCRGGGQVLLASLSSALDVLYTRMVRLLSLGTFNLPFRDFTECVGRGLCSL